MRTWYRASGGVVRDSELHDWPRLRRVWGWHLPLAPQPVSAVEVTLYAATGSEPIAPEVEVTLLPTLVVTPRARPALGAPTPVGAERFTTEGLAVTWTDVLGGSPLETERDADSNRRGGAR